MNLRRIRNWFAWPDAVRSPWKRRLVWGAPLMVVVVGVTTWRGCVPPLGEDVTLRDVSREEAAVIVDEIRKERSARAFGALWRGRLMDCYSLFRPAPVTNVALGYLKDEDTEKNLAVVITSDRMIYYLGRTNGGWRINTSGVMVRKK
jgi:hypothetical protein